MTLTTFFFLLTALCNDSEDIIYNLKIYRLRYLLWCTAIISPLKKHNCSKYTYTVSGKEISLPVKHFPFPFHILSICSTFPNLDHTILLYRNIITNTKTGRLNDWMGKKQKKLKNYM